jgi:hypothetical protein
MKSIFTHQVFGGNFTPRTLSGPLDDILHSVGVSEEDIEKLLAKIPADAMPQYRAKFDECKAKGLTSPEGAACLYRLYQELRNGDESAPPPATPPAPPKSQFPIVPVAIGAVILAGVGIYFAVKG